MGTLRFLINPPGAGALTTTEQTSVTWRGRTVNFAAPVAVGRDATGRPIIPTDRAISVAGFDLPSAQDSGGFWKNGATKNAIALTPESPQGWDGRVGVGIAYDHSLNVDPAATSQPILIAPGEAAIITKSTRRPSAETVTTNQQLDPFAHFYFLPPGLCRDGMLAPGPTKLDQTIYNVADLRGNVFRDLTAPPGWPTAAQVLAMDEEAWPYFGWSGERLRRIQTAGRLIGAAPGPNYSGDIGHWTSLLLYAAQYTPPGPDRDALLLAIARHTLDIDAAHQTTSWKGLAGAGQHHIDGAIYVAGAFILGDAAMLSRAVAHKSNTFTHPTILQGAYEGVPVAYPDDDGQDYQNNSTHFADDADKPWWAETFRGSQISTRYLKISLPVGVREAFPVLLMQNGPSGESGVEAVLNGPNDSTNPRRALLQIYDRIKDWPELDRPFAATSPFAIDWRAIIADWRGLMPEYGWTGTPERLDHKSSGQNFTTNIAGGFAWNLGIPPWTGGTGNSPITEYGVEYSIDGRQWIDSGLNTAIGSASGLLRGLEQMGRYRRRNANGWSKWSQNFPMASTPDSAEYPATPRHMFTPGGATTAAAPVNTVAPIMVKRRYPAWGADDYLPVGTIAPDDVDLSGGLGYWSAYPAAMTYEFIWQRRVGGTTVTTVGSAQDYGRVAADASHELRFGLRATNASGTSAWVYTAWAAVPALATLPAGVHVHMTMRASDRVDFEALWQGITASGGVLRHMPDMVYGAQPASNANFVPLGAAPGAICVDKSVAYPAGVIPLGTYPAGTYRIRTTAVLGLTYDGQIEDYAAAGHVVQVINQATIAGATHLLASLTSGVTFTPNTPGVPKQIALDTTITLTSPTPLFLRHLNMSSAGTSTGGDVIVMEVLFEDV